MSMTRTLHGQCDPADLIFVHNARTPQDIIFRDDLDDIAARPDVQVHVIGEANSPTEEWTGTFGRLTLLTGELMPEERSHVRRPHRISQPTPVALPKGRHSEPRKQPSGRCREPAPSTGTSSVHSGAAVAVATLADS